MQDDGQEDRIGSVSEYAEEKLTADFRTQFDTENAVDRFLDAEPLSVAAHFAKAEWRERAGDKDAACLLYEKGLKLAQYRQLSAVEATEAGQAEQRLAALRERTHDLRKARLSSRGLPSGEWSPRFRHALELAAGHRKRYVQEPTAFTYPGLPDIPFFDRDQFDWVAGIEAATPAIRDELANLLSEKQSQFRAYIQNDASSGPLGGNKSLLNNSDWSVLTLCENGWLTPDIIARCPRTWEAVLHAPLPRIAGWGPTAVFSMLKSGARIAAHTGMFNTRLICHLPLIVPPGCRFRVGDEVREWEEGKLMIFDDTIEHEAWNEGADDRIVLIFDIWRPELSEQERFELTALFSD